MAEIPESLLRRSAEAKAKALGLPVEQVLAEMKGEAPPPRADSARGGTRSPHPRRRQTPDARRQTKQRPLGAETPEAETACRRRRQRPEAPEPEKQRGHGGTVSKPPEPEAAPAEPEPSRTRET